MIRFRHGLIVGFALGYYLGAKAGRSRYEQMNAMLDRIRNTQQYLETRTTLSDLFEQGKSMSMEMVDQATGGAVDMILNSRSPEYPGGDHPSGDVTLN